MNKPESVEAGQWWMVNPMIGPVRIELISGRSMTAIHSGGHGETSLALLCADGTYLGNGEHPEPSEWMIETLVKHANEVIPPKASAAAPDYDAATIRHMLNGGTTMSMSPREGAAMNRSVLSVYRILRDLGKW